MAKYITIEMTLGNDAEVHSDLVQDGMLQAVMTIEAVLDARVVGVGEGPDPAPAPGPDADNPEGSEG